MSKIKYSIVLPILNGEETLQLTIPYLLNIQRDDIEFVVSNNHSSDKTKEILLGTKDKRLKYFAPETKLQAGDNLDFAYSHASGEWQTHIGHDDLISSCRFDILDDITSEVNVDIICGTGIGYYWHDYPELSKANSLDPCNFNHNIEITDGKKIAHKMINERSIQGGGSWSIRKNIIQKVRDRASFFSPPVTVEFFAMRAACLVSEKVAIIQKPLYIQGRHTTSSGTQALSNAETTKSKKTWDWNFENPDSWSYSPFKWNGYVPVSLDAALHVMNVFKQEFKDIDIDWWKWVRSAECDILKLIHNGQYPPESIRLFYDGLKKTPISRTKFELFKILRWTYRHISRKHLDIKEVIGESDIIKTDKFFNDGKTWGWDHHLDGNAVGVKTITDIPSFLKENFKNNLRYETKESSQ